MKQDACPEVSKVPAKSAGFTPEEIERMETDELLRTYKATGDANLKWPLVMRYEGLIKNAALQIKGVYSSFAQVDDIVSEGILTLLGAVDKFDPEKGIKFETYVSKRIRGMVVDLARKQDWLPRNIRKRAKEIDQATTELYSTLGRFPTEAEVAEHLDVPLAKYQKEAASLALCNVLSLDALLDGREPGGGRFECSDQDLQTQPEAVLQEQEYQSVLAEGIRSLRKNEQIVLSLYYEKNLHMKEIAQVMQVSEPRISQIHARAIQKLRVYMEQYLNEEDTPSPKGRGREKKEKKGKGQVHV